MGSGEASSAAAACLHIQESWLRLLLAAVGERQLLRSLLLAIREVRQQAVIREIERVRVLLVEFDDRVQPVHDGGVAHLDRRSEEHMSELQSRLHLVCRLLLEKKKTRNNYTCSSYLTTLTTRC